MSRSINVHISGPAGDYVAEVAPGQGFDGVSATGQHPEFAVERLVEKLLRASEEKMLTGNSKKLADGSEDEDDDLDELELHVTEEVGLSGRSAIFPGLSDLQRGDGMILFRIHILDESILVATFADGSGEVIEESVLRGTLYHPRNGSVIRTYMRYGYPSQSFRHDWNVAELLTLENDKLLTQCVDRFESEINPGLGDPYRIGALSQAEEPVTFHCGSEEALTAAVRDIVVAHLPVDEISWPVYVSVIDPNEANEDYPLITLQEIGPNPKSFEVPVSKEMEALVMRVAMENRFSGRRYSYNDGSYIRTSGYNELPGECTFVIERPTRHEKLLAARRLSEGGAIVR
jgi:hypothetical protein